MSDIIKSATPVERSFEGMRNGLFDVWDAVRSGSIDPKQVDGIAKISAQLCKSVDVELKVRKLAQQAPSSVHEEEKHATFKLVSRKG